MALEQRTRPYETLIRHNDDGSIGAHHVTIKEILLDGVVINATINPPQPVDGQALADVLGADLAAALADNANLRAQVGQLQAQVQQLQQQLGQAGATIETLQGEAQAAAAALDKQSAALAQAAALVESLQASAVAAVDGAAPAEQPAA